MPLRRSFAATVATVVVAVPLLASCGFNLNTDLVYNPATGTNDRSGTVDVLAAVVVSSSPGEGTFIATFSNNDQSKPATFASVQAGSGGDLEGGEADSVEIAPGGFVNLAEDDGTDGVKLTGSFVAGDTVPLSIGFGDGSTVDLVVPVVTACAEYAGLDSGVSPSSGASVSPSDAPETGSPSDEASVSTAPELDTEGSTSPDEESEGQETDPYACTSTAEQE